MSVVKLSESEIERIIYEEASDIIKNNISLLLEEEPPDLPGADIVANLDKRRAEYTYSDNPNKFYKAKWQTLSNREVKALVMEDPEGFHRVWKSGWDKWMDPRQVREIKNISLSPKEQQQYLEDARFALPYVRELPDEGLLGWYRQNEAFVDVMGGTVGFFIPIWGDILGDLPVAIKDLYKGDYISAFLGFLAAVPGAGVAFGAILTAIRTGNKLGVVTAAKALSQTGLLGKNLDKAAVAAEAHITKVGKELQDTQNLRTAWEAIRRGGPIAQAYGFGRTYDQFVLSMAKFTRWPFSRLTIWKQVWPPVAKYIEQIGKVDNPEYVGYFLDQANRTIGGIIGGAASAVGSAGMAVGKTVFTPGSYEDVVGGPSAQEAPAPTATAPEVEELTQVTASGQRGFMQLANAWNTTPEILADTLELTSWDAVAEYIEQGKEGGFKKPEGLK